MRGERRKEDRRGGHPREVSGVSPWRVSSKNPSATPLQTTDNNRQKQRHLVVLGLDLALTSPQEL